MVVIEKGIPIPKKGHSYPFSEMEVNDSLFAESAGIVTASCRFAREHEGFKFISRKLENGYRVWRIQ